MSFQFKRPLDEDPFIQGIAMFVDHHVKSAVGPLMLEITALKTRLAEVEKRGVEYCGVWQRAATYRRGHMTTHDGSLWACIQDTETNECPGVSDRWQLCAKKGLDAPERRSPTQRRTA